MAKKYILMCEIAFHHNELFLENALGLTKKEINMAIEKLLNYVGQAEGISEVIEKILDDNELNCVQKIYAIYKLGCCL